MLFVVVPVIVVSIVVSLLFISVVALVLSTGVVAPPYHLNHIFSFYCDYFSQSSGAHYARRGGDSTAGLYCGAFCVSLGSYSGAASWYFGAALSFKPISDYIL